MTVTTISRVYFHWYEYAAMLKFEAEYPDPYGTDMRGDEHGL